MKLYYYLKKAYLHLERLKEILEQINRLYPVTQEKINNLTLEEKNALDVLAFRFSKLQDLLGVKIFREYLKSQGFITEGKPYRDILKEIDNEGIIDIDTWSEFREVRNNIAHEYPYDENEKINAINYLIQNISLLETIIKEIDARSFK